MKRTAMTAAVVVVALAGAAAEAHAGVEVGAGYEQLLATDKSFDLVSHDDVLPMARLTLGYALGPSFVVEAAYGTGGRSAGLFSEETARLGVQSVGGALRGRWEARPWFVPYVRAGGGAWRASLDVERYTGASMRDAQWTPAAGGEVGFELVASRRSLGTGAWKLPLEVRLSAAAGGVWVGGFDFRSPSSHGENGVSREAVDDQDALKALPVRTSPLGHLALSGPTMFFGVTIAWGGSGDAAQVRGAQERSEKAWREHDAEEGAPAKRTDDAAERGLESAPRLETPVEERVPPPADAPATTEPANNGEAR